MEYRCGLAFRAVVKFGMVFDPRFWGMIRMWTGNTIPDGVNHRRCWYWLNQHQYRRCHHRIKLTQIEGMPALMIKEKDSRDES